MIPACFFFFCWFAPPATVPDGAGGYVPFTNSRVMPDGSLRPYDPIIDGTVAYGPYPSIVAMPGAPTDYPDLVEGPPPAPDYVYPEDYAGLEQAPPPKPRRHHRAQVAHHACYDANGKFVGADNEECR